MSQIQNHEPHYVGGYKYIEELC